MRTPNAKCVVCGKPLYRRPSELARVRYVACMEHRNAAQANAGLTDAQLAALALGRRPGTNNRTGYKHKDESKLKVSKANARWCAENPDKVRARGEKTRGLNHYNWKGGSSRLNTTIRRMTEHRKWMDAIVWRDGKCMVCGAQVDLEAHHKTPLAEIVAMYQIKTQQQARECAALWDIENGITLCQECHCKEHGRAHVAQGTGRRKRAPKERRPMRGEGNPNWQGGRVMLVCPVCNRHFEVKASDADRRVTCSRGCQHEHQRRHV